MKEFLLAWGAEFLVVQLRAGYDPFHDDELISFVESCPAEKETVALLWGHYKDTIPETIYRRRVADMFPASRVIRFELGWIERDRYFQVRADDPLEEPEYQELASSLAEFRRQHLGSLLMEQRGHAIHRHSLHRDASLLIAGQVPWDTAVQGENHLGWLRQRIEEAAAGDVFRPHPKVGLGVYEGIPELARSKGVLVQDPGSPPDWSRVRWVVTQSSTLAVDALMNGVPAFQDSERSPLSLASRVCPGGDPIRTLETFQWSLEEIARGDWLPWAFY